MCRCTGPKHLSSLYLLPFASSFLHFPQCPVVPSCQWGKVWRGDSNMHVHTDDRVRKRTALMRATVRGPCYLCGGRQPQLCSARLRLAARLKLSSGYPGCFSDTRAAFVCMMHTNTHTMQRWMQRLANCAEHQQHYSRIQPTFHSVINAAQFTVERREISTSDGKFIRKTPE